MCGIYGCVGRRISRGLADRCCDRLRHRGPDGRGVWQEGDVTLAHRRLSIIDLTESGSQPMSFADGRYWITFNGEIYNYIEIKKGLERDGYHFSSDSDTEVILAAYHAWGEGCVVHFNGMWAFAIYDREERVLFLSRDRFGVKPLYYALKDGALIFASEMKAIMPCLEQVRINGEMIRFFRMFHHYEFRKDCLVQGIERFPAGHSAVFKDGKLQIKRYWNTLDHLMEIPTSYGEQVEMFRELFIDACRLRMRSDVSIGTSLSGGLDSSAVLCAMHAIASRGDGAAYQRDWQHAYVAGFKGSVLDETAYAKIVTDYVGIGSTHIDIQDTLDEGTLYRQAYLLEELWMNTQIPQMAIYENERLGGTVVSIDGHGADELFGGYSTDMQFALLDVLDKDGIKMLARTIREAENIDDDFADMGSWMKKRIRKTKIRYLCEVIYRKTVLKGDYCQHPRFREMDRLAQSLCVQTHEKTLPTLLRNYDRDSMASGVEIRMPFMDHRIVAFAMSLPWRSKIRDGYPKAIIRDALQDIMPYEIAYRRDKKGFNAPIGEWIRKSADVYMDLVSSTRFAGCEAVRDPKKIRSELERFIKDEDKDYLRDLARAQRLWQEINLFIWEEVMIKDKVP